MKFLLLAAAAALTAAAALPAAAQITNPSFETGDLSGWASNPGANGAVAVVTSSTDIFQFNTFGPTDGSDFAQLTSGDVGVYTLLDQGFTLSQTSTISLDVNFVAFDITPDYGRANDDAYVRLIDQAQHSTYIYRVDVNAVGDFGSSGWTTIHAANLAAGAYTLEAGVENAAGNDDLLFSSQLLVDNVQVATGAVPEPAAWALMIAGFGLAGATLRRRRAEPRAA